MKLSEKIIVALKTNNAKMAGEVADQMRFGNIIRNYREMMEFVAKATNRPVEEVTPEWDALLAESELVSE